MKNVAVILASGSGTRAGFPIPKQLVKLAGRPLIEHTIEAFERHPAIDEIAVVTSIDCRDQIESIVTSAGFRKVKRVLLGGAQRTDSSVAAIDAYYEAGSAQDVNLIYHDAVRPLISKAIIDRVVEALTHYRAVDVVVPCTDTIIEMSPKTSQIVQIPPRARLRSGQTPQGFRLDVIKRAYDGARRDPNFESTDDCGVVVRYLPDEPVYLVEGESTNIKLTYPGDLALLDKLMQVRTTQREEAADDAFRLAALRGRRLAIFGGTSGIGADMASLAIEYGAHVDVASRRSGVDITNLQSVQEFLSDVVARRGGVDYVINSAAVLHRQPLGHMSSAELDQALDINYRGTVYVAYAAHALLKQTRGGLMLFASSSYTYGRSFYSIYSSSKAAVVNLTQALADEWHADGIRVNCLNPERTATPMRVQAFGVEPPETLLSSEHVAREALQVLVSDLTGRIIDVRR